MHVVSDTRNGENREMHPNFADRMANIVDPDQTAPDFGLPYHSENSGTLWK